MVRSFDSQLAYIAPRPRLLRLAYLEGAAAFLAGKSYPPTDSVPKDRTITDMGYWDARLRHKLAKAFGSTLSEYLSVLERDLDDEQSDVQPPQPPVGDTPLEDWQNRRSTQFANIYREAFRIRDRLRLDRPVDSWIGEYLSMRSTKFSPATAIPFFFASCSPPLATTVTSRNKAQAELTAWSATFYDFSQDRSQQSSRFREELVIAYADPTLANISQAFGSAAARLMDLNRPLALSKQIDRFRLLAIGTTQLTGLVADGADRGTIRTEWRDQVMGARNHLLGLIIDSDWSDSSVPLAVQTGEVEDN